MSPEFDGFRHITGDVLNSLAPNKKYIRPPDVAGSESL